MKLSVVATLYCSAGYIEEFHRRVTETASPITNDYEIILVNDGSPDNSLDIAHKVADRDKHVAVVDLSRNFGHHKAMMTGLSYAQGERVFLIDSDLEESPEWLAQFTQEMDKTGCDVVYGIQSRRKGGWFERISGAIFWKLFRRLSHIDFPENPVTARLMTRRYLDALLQFRERELFLFGILHIAGFEQHAMQVTKLSTSATTYTLSRKMSLLTNSMVAFSTAPLIMIFEIGMIILALSIAMSGWVIFRWALGKTPMGWVSVMLSVWLLGGLIISFIGIVGIYLSKIYSETKQRPLTIVREIYRK